MSKISQNCMSYTPTATADTTNLTDVTYLAIQGGTSTQRSKIVEVFQGGQAGASAPTFSILARDSTIGVTLSNTSGGRNAALDAAVAAIASPPVGFNTATTKPQRSSTLALLNLSYNAFGGIVRWVEAPGMEVTIVGNTASLGEISLSTFTGGTPGLM